MTVPATGRRTRVEIAREHVEPALRRRVAAFGNGELYVEAGWLATFMAWLVDFVVFVLGVAVGVVVLGAVSDSAGLSDDVVTVLALALLLVVPVLYGLWYGNGRALGAVLTGTQLVRLSDGGRIGRKACWAMLLRTVFLPLLLLAVVLSALDASGWSPGGSPVRTSINRAATERLRATALPDE